MFALRGTPKQKEFANAIRKSKFTSNDPADYGEDFDLLRQIRSAKFWIENRHLNYPELVKAAKKYNQQLKASPAPSNFTQMVGAKK